MCDRKTNPQKMENAYRIWIFVLPFSIKAPKYALIDDLKDV